MIDPFQYFHQPAGFLRLNELLNHFPKFNPIRLSEFLAKNAENLSLANYSFQKVYEAFINSKTISDESKDNFIFTLNSLSPEILSKLIDINLPNLFATYRKLYGIFVYFKLLSQDNLYGLVEYFAESYSKSNRKNILYKFKLCHIIPFLDEKRIQIFMNEPSMKEFKQDFCSVFSRDELIFLVQHNPSVYEIITSTHGKDSELEYETNIGYTDFSEIEQVLVWFYDEFQTEREKYKSGQIYDMNVLKENNHGIYLRLEYVLSFLKDMPESKREMIIEGIATKEKYRNMIMDIDLETLINLHKTNFKFLDYIKK